MSKLLSALKDEVLRISRKEIRAETDALRKASSRHRAEIAALKRQLARLEKQSRDGATGRAAPAPASESETTGKLRFRADGFRSHRGRLGVPVKDMAALLDVSVQTVANWESGKTRPRAGQLQRIAEVRKLGKREVAQRLAARDAATATN